MANCCWIGKVIRNRFESQILASLNETEFSIVPDFKCADEPDETSDETDDTTQTTTKTTTTKTTTTKTTTTTSTTAAVDGFEEPHQETQSEEEHEEEPQEEAQELGEEEAAPADEKSFRGKFQIVQQTIAAPIL